MTAQNVNDKRTEFMQAERQKRYEEAKQNDPEGVRQYEAKAESQRPKKK